MRSAGKRLLSTAAYIVLAVALLIITPLALFLPATLLHCGIRNGRRAAWGVLLVAAGVVFLITVPLAQSAQTPAQLANDTLTSLLGLVLAVGLPSVLALP